jgi:hypothetical protein
MLLIVALVAVALDLRFASPAVPCNGVGSFYVPNVGTRNLHGGYRFCRAPRIAGQRPGSPIVITSNVEGSIVRIDPEGSVRWVHRDPNPRSTRLLNATTAEFIANGYRKTINVETGVILSAHKLDRKLRCVGEDVTCEKDGVRVTSKDVLIPAQYPRDAIRVTDVVYVADTFGHRVFAYDLRREEVVFQQPVYFPNDLSLIDDGRTLLVAAEHENRILAIDLETKTSSIFAGCKAVPFADPTTTPEAIQAAEKSGALTGADGKGVCAGDMYSPNGVTANADGTALVADTDNHRVLWLDRMGKRLATFEPFNNPVSALFLQ